ncbi:hypothetical protein MD484_g5668, partial [Candolleomyces efflorescens]
MQDNHNLRELILLVTVTLSAKCQNEKFGTLSLAEAEFLKGWIRAVQEVGSFDYTDEESLRTAEEHIDQCITSIKTSHPSLRDIKAKPRRGLSGAVVSALDIGIPVITVLKDAVEIVGAVPFMKPILGAVLVMSQAARQTQSNYEGMLALSTTAGEFALSIVERCSTLQVLPKNLDGAVKKLESRLRAIALRCQEMSEKNFISCFFQTTGFKEELDDLRRTLDSAIQEFQNTNLIDIQDGLEQIVEALHRTAGNVEWVRLDGLPRHPDTSGKLAEYLVQSRTSDVEHICDWIERSNELLLCIHGTAGVGKSTLASHLAKELRASGRLAGSIFLGTFPTDTSGAETIIKMLAHEIGSIHPKLRPKILEAMQQCHGTSLETHLQKYILAPLRSLNQPYPLIIIVDALDEWRDHATFLSALSHLNSNTSVLKLIGTSRLNPVASHLPGIHKVSVRPYLLSPVSMGVIKQYFEKHLESVPWVDGRRAHSADIDKLAELSGGLPIWAATVIALLSYQFSTLPPHEVLTNIVGSRLQVGGGSGSDALRDLYENALKRLFTTPDTQRQFRLYFGAIIALQASLPISDFSKLTGISTHLVNQIQAVLPALYTRPLPQGSAEKMMVHPATAVFHLSLIEHVQAAAETGTPFGISAPESHSTLALSCLEQLPTLPSPSPNPDSQLRAIQQYAVKYWLLHVSKGTSRSKKAWSQTKHCSALQTISASTQRRWAILFHSTLMPGDDSLELKADDGLGTILAKLAHQLDKSGGNQWGLQVACLEVAVRIDDSDAEAWTDLGRCYYAQGERVGGIQMRQEALAAFRRALHLQPESHPNHAASLDRVAYALGSCYQLNGDQATLGEMISHSRKALTHCLAPHPDRNIYLTTLANALEDLYQHNGDLQTLEEVVSLCRERLGLCPAPHPNRAAALNNLANALQALHAHEEKGNIDALNEAISLHYEALALHPTPHLDRSLALHNLAVTLDELYHSNNDENALHKAISLYHQALALRPPPHPLRSSTLYNLALSLESRYKRDGEISTLKESISLHREALGLWPSPHPNRPHSLRNFAGALLSHFEKTREVGDLDEAISLRRELLVLNTPGRRYRRVDLKDALHLLKIRREVTKDEGDCGEIDDLEKELAGLRTL